MVYRKLISNLLAALLAPIILSVVQLPRLYNAVFYNIYDCQSYRYSSLKEFLCAVYCEVYPVVFVLSLLIFLPFQLIKNHYYKKGRKLSFIKRIGLMALIVIALVCFFGTFISLWLFPLSHNVFYIGLALGIAVVFTPLFHFLVDRYEK